MPFLVPFQFLTLFMIPVPNCSPLQTQNNKLIKPSRGSMWQMVKFRLFGVAFNAPEDLVQIPC